MPASAEEGRTIMLNWITSRRPRSVLDVGAGCGTYGKLLRQQHNPPYLIGVEIWAPYVGKYTLRDIYDLVVVEDVRTFLPETGICTDVVIFGDVLEHMPEKDAVSLWDMARGLARKAIYLSLPVVPCPQGEVHGNPYEEHVVPDWTHERVMDTFHGITWHWQGTIVGRYEAARRP
jgi:hypothetical protein